MLGSSHLRVARVASLLAFAIGALASLPEPAFARAPTRAPETTPTPGSRAIAKGQEALALFERGEYGAALAMFQEADALYHSPVFLLYAGRSLERLGRWTEATAMMRRVAIENVETAPPPWKRAKADAQAELAVIAAAMPRVVVTVQGGSPATTVILDDAPIEQGKQIELDPGEHRIKASDGDRTETTSVTVRASTGVADIVVRLPPVTTASVPEPAPAPPAGPPVASRSGLYVPGAAVAGVGAVVVITGGVLGVLALTGSSAARNDLPETCDGTTCPASRRGEIEESFASSKRLATVSDVMLVSGGVAVVVGVCLMIIHPGARPPVSAGMARSGGSLSLRF